MRVRAFPRRAAAAASAVALAWHVGPAPASPAPTDAQATCRALKDVAPPAADTPTPAEAARLADCSSEALYYGIGRPADPKAARLCAFVEKRSADPQVTDFGFNGDRMLMTVYANGLGAPRNLALATALACRAGGASAEVAGRVAHLARLDAERWAGTDFSLCDDITSGLMRGVCAAHGQLIARAAAAESFAALSARWSAADKTAYAPLRRAAAAFADAHAQGEVDLSGTGRAAFEIAAEERVSRAFARLLADAEAGRVAPATPDDAKAGDDALSAASRALMARAPELARSSTLKVQGFTAAERAWLRYRDAWLAFAKVRYPALSADALVARLSRERAAQLADVPDNAD